ncbi:MAG TPA: methyltransferase domain-containing protein [Candidatus Nanoarchaeia archaeon]|nr:methyltransferase domain-containing protein [Candidatus Nanoarchaeia archaeon]
MYNPTGGSALLDVNFIMAKARIKERMRVADLGCGTSGHFVFPAAKIVGPHGLVYAVDILKPSLESIARRARQENIQNIITVWSDLEVYRATKIETESLDVALLINTLFHSQKRAEILRESIRMIKRGGYLLVVEWESASSPFGPTPEKRVKIEQLKNVTQKLGLKIEEEFDAGEFHYGVLFSKI